MKPFNNNVMDLFSRTDLKQEKWVAGLNITMIPFEKKKNKKKPPQ